MDLRADLFDPKTHYNLICDWWVKNNWPVIPLSHLPRFGLIAFVDNEPAVAGFLYATDSSFCWLEWIVASPNVRHEKRQESIHYLIQELKSASKKMGFESIFTSANKESLISKLEKENFKVCDRNVTQLLFQGGI